MENTENTAPAVVIEEANDMPAELPADELFENLTSTVEEEPEQEAPAQEEPTQEDVPAAGDVPPLQENDPPAEDELKQSIKNGVQELFEDGWTVEELTAFSKDKTVREQIAAGKDIMRVATAYERRQRTASKPAKKSVPTLRAPATAGAKDYSAISEMTDAQFDEFSKRAKEALMQGKLVSFK